MVLNYFFITRSTRGGSNTLFSKPSAVKGINFGCPPEVPELHQKLMVYFEELWNSLQKKKKNENRSTTFIPLDKLGDGIS